MHGIKRSPQSPSALAARRLKDAPKISAYRTTVDALLLKKAAKEYDEVSLDLTTKALQLNPELYTAWNFRREVLSLGIFPSSAPEEIYELLLKDLMMTTMILKTLPKVYWIWNHRRWCLEQIPDGPRAASRAEGVEGSKGEVSEEAEDDTWRREAWERELKLVDKMLTADPRNFHAWDYRRVTLASLPSSSAIPNSRSSELAFTQKKIESSFSNFSAWHQRGKVLGSEPGFVGGEQEMDAEFALVSQALWTDPSDQSAWLYHRFLINKTSNDSAILSREIATLKELLDLEPESKWPLDTLVHYTRLLLPSLPEKERAGKIEEIERWLDVLERVDEGRRERYREIRAEVVKEGQK